MEPELSRAQQWKWDNVIFEMDQIEIMQHLCMALLKFCLCENIIKDKNSLCPIPTAEPEYTRGRMTIMIMLMFGV